MIRKKHINGLRFIIALSLAVLFAACDLPNLDIPDQTIIEGEAFQAINLDEHAAEDVADPENLTWSFYGNQNLIVSIDENRVATVETPNENWNGSETIYFVASHTGGQTGLDSAVFTVTPVNDPPTAVDDAYSVDEDAVLTVSAPGILGNDSDVDNSPGELTAVLVDAPSAGTLTLNADNGAFTYTPNGNFNGDDSFTYKPNDGILDGGLAVVSIEVLSINDAPVANDQSLTTDEDTELSIVLTASDVESEVLTYTVVGPPANGTLSGEPPDLTYTPDLNYEGPDDSFTFIVNDGDADSNVATISITINSVNDAPVAVIDNYYVDEGKTLNVQPKNKGVLANDTDVEGDALTAHSVSEPANGTLTLFAADGTFTYTPDTGYIGFDHFEYNAHDGQLYSSNTRVEIEVGAFNYPPTLEAPIGNVSVNEDAPDTVIDLSEAFDDVNIASNEDFLTLSVEDGYDQTLISASLEGTTLVLAYLPDQNGETTVTIRATDRAGEYVDDAFDVTVDPVNDAPLAESDTVETNEDTPLDVALKATDADSAVLTYSVVDPPTHGTLSGTPPNLTYTPDLNYHGPDSFTFKANDGETDSVEDATVTITIHPVNDAPFVASEIIAVSVAEDAPDTEINLADVFDDVDIDTNADVLTYQVTYHSNPSLLTATISGSILTLDYVSDKFGTADLTVSATDTQSASITDSFTVSVTPVNDPPVGIIDEYETDEDTPLIISAPGVLSNDEDVEENALTAILVDEPPYGTVSLNSDGSFTYTPEKDYYGADGFSYKPNDGALDGDATAVIITVNPINDPPVADDQSVTTNEDIPLAIVLTASDVDSASMTFAVVDPPDHGTLTGTPPNLTYTPVLNYHGPDSFTFKTNDGEADSNVATITITVNPVNDPPKADPDTDTTNEDTILTVNAPGVLGNDYEDPIEGDAITTATLVSEPSQGDLTLNSDGSFDFNPAGDFEDLGTDESRDATFTYTATDEGGATSQPATVTITVTGVNDAPVANDQSATTNEDTPLGIVLTASDVDSTDLTYAVVDSPSHGTLTGTPPNLTYTPASNYEGPGDSFTFKVNDGETDSVENATVTITINPVNDPPIAESDAYTTDEDSIKTVGTPGVLGNDHEDAATGEEDPITTATKVSDPDLGSVILKNDGSFDFNPGNDFQYLGTDESREVAFTYTATDAPTDAPGATSQPATVTITVTGVNDAPVANDQFVTTNEDIPLAIVLTASDVDSADLTYAVVDSPSHGALTGTPPNLTYTPVLNYHGPDSFTFKVNDSETDSVENATVTITINPVNDPPIAESDAYTTDEDSIKTVGTPGVLGNDHEDAATGEEDPITTATKVSDPDLGSVILKNDGSFDFNPGNDFQYLGTDESREVAFTYTATDAPTNAPGATSQPATVTITVTGINDAPVITVQNNLVYTPEMTPVEITLNDMTVVDPDDDTFTLTIDSSNGYTIDSTTITPDEGIHGILPVKVHVSDGELDSNPFFLNVRVGDAGPPCSLAISPSGKEGSGEIIITYVANDGFADETCSETTIGSGVQQVSLYVKEPDSSEFTYYATDSTIMDGQFAYTLSQEGLYYFRTLAIDNEGNEEAKAIDVYDSTTLYAETFSGYAIIGMGDATGVETSSFSLTANNIYQHFITRKFGISKDLQDPLDHIKYFAPTGPDNEGEDDILQSGTSYKDALEKSITEWAPARIGELPGPLYIVLTGDANTTDVFELTSSEAVTAAELKGWLDTLESELETKGLVHSPIVIILGFSYSGSFIDDLSDDLALSDRIIITSSDTSEVSYRGPSTSESFHGGDFFIETLFAQWAREDQVENMDLRSAFEISVRQAEEYADSGSRYAVFPHFDTSRQHPLLDDNADDKGSNDLNPAGISGYGTFKKMAFYDAGDGPVSVSKGDFNDDTLTDLAVANQNTNTISILLRNGACNDADCIYKDEDAVSYSTGDTPVAVVTGLFNADAVPDLAVANAGSDNVSVYLGNGDGSFQAAAIYTAGDSPSGLAVGDINEDTQADLVVSNQNSSDISILAGNADGTFQTAVNHNTEASPSAVVIGRFNDEDDHLDLAVTSKDSHTVSIFLGNGDGTFTDSDGDGTLDANDDCPEDPFKTTPGICGCDISDTTDSDDDGTLDCSDACPGNPNKTDPGTCGCDVADIDSDGDLTLDCNDACPYDANKTENSGDCGCGASDTDSDSDGIPDCNDACPLDDDKTEPGTCGCGIADTDSDENGTLDCIDACPEPCADKCPDDPDKTEPGTCGCGATEGCTDQCPDDPAKTSPGLCGCGVSDTDSDGDEIPDCYDDCDDSTNLDGDGKSVCNDLCDTDDQKFVPGVCGCNIIDEDSDNDGVMDCNDDCPDDADKVFPGIKGCGTPDPEFKTYPAGESPTSIAAADFDKDDQIDLVVANETSGNISILLGNADGSFEAPVPYEAADMPSAVTTDDFNQDSNPDIAVANNGSFLVSVLLGNGDGSFQTALNYGSGDNPSAIISDNIDLDEFPDLIVTNQGSDNITLMLTKTDNGADENTPPDGSLAEDRFLGYRTDLPGPLKIETTGTSPDEQTPLTPGPDEIEATLWLTVNDNTRVQAAWVEIRPPGMTLDTNPAFPVIDLTRVDLVWNNVDRYEGVSSAFIDSGRYRLHFFIQDTDGRISSVAAPDSYSSTSSGFTNYYKDTLNYDEDSLYARYLYKEEADNQAPEFHSFINIEENGDPIETERGFMLAWSAATDPEKYQVTYIIVVKDLAETVLFRQDGISSTYFLLPASLFENRSGDEITIEIYAQDNYGLQSVLSDKMTATTTIGTGTALDGLLKGHVYNAHKLDWPIDQGKIIIADQTFDLYEGGYFSIPLPVGTYRVDVEVEGYHYDINYGIEILEGGITTYHIDLTPLDSDGDGVPDIEDPCPDDPDEWLDTDGDGECDGPDDDADGDYMEDKWEENFGFDPLDKSDAQEDADGDGLSNLDEFLLKTDPRDPADPCGGGKPDRDGDCVPDDDDPCPDDPTEWLDTDGDGECDGPDDDADGDGMPDEWEEDNGLNPFDPDDADDDPDNDGYTNLEEYQMGTNPRNAIPFQPEIISPADGATNVSLTPQLETNAFQDPNHMDTHASSQWQISTDPEFSTAILWDAESTQNLTSVTLPEFLLSPGETYYWRVRFYDSENAASPWSEIRSFSVVQRSEEDENNNGIPDDQEIEDPDLDMDGNGVPDIEQENMRCVRFGPNEMIMCIQIPENVISVDSLKGIDPYTIEDSDNRPFTLPFGLISFKLAVVLGAETEVTVFLSEPMPVDTEWYKYDLIDGWHIYHDYAFIDPSRTSVLLKLKDGDFGDGDGAENGIILDPSGPGSSPVSIYANYSGLGDDAFCFIQTAGEGFPTINKLTH